jgi:predicted GNAT family acetyltransferase
MADVTNNKQKSRFEITVDGHTAVMEYMPSDGQIAVTHTEVPDALEGQGLGSMLAKAALEHARSNGLKVVPYCEFLAGYLKRHPEYSDVVVEP